MNESGKCVLVASGEMQAQQAKAFLESAGIASTLRGESVRNTFGLTLDGLGVVEVFVAASDADRASELLRLRRAVPSGWMMMSSEGHRSLRERGFSSQRNGAAEGTEYK